MKSTGSVVTYLIFEFLIPACYTYTHSRIRVRVHCAIVHSAACPLCITRSSAIAGRPCDAKAYQGLRKWTWK